METAMVIYAYNPITHSIWIYGVFKNRDLGFDEMTKMQESEDYGHLMWSNNIVKLL